MEGSEHAQLQRTIFKILCLGFNVIVFFNLQLP